MPKIIFISGACGSGKSTFADALARHLVRQDHKTVYVIHYDNTGKKPEDAIHDNGLEQYQVQFLTA